MTTKKKDVLNAQKSSKDTVGESGMHLRGRVWSWRAKWGLGKRGGVEEGGHHTWTEQDKGEQAARHDWDAQ